MSVKDFNEEELRLDLIDTTGKELKSISNQTTSMVTEQLQMIDACSSSFKNVQDNCYFVSL